MHKEEKIMFNENFAELWTYNENKKLPDIFSEIF